MFYTAFHGLCVCVCVPGVCNVVSISLKFSSQELSSIYVMHGIDSAIQFFARTHCCRFRLPSHIFFAAFGIATELKIEWQPPVRSDGDCAQIAVARIQKPMEMRQTSFGRRRHLVSAQCAPNASDGFDSVVLWSPISTYTSMRFFRPISLHAVNGGCCRCFGCAACAR